MQPLTAHAVDADAERLTPGPQDIAELDARVSQAVTMDARLRLLAGQARGRLSFSTSLGIEDQVLLDGIVRAGIDVDVFTLDTGRLFPETFDVIDDSERRYGVRIRVIMPQPADVARLVARDGINGFRLSIDARKACCDARKVEPLRRALDGAGLWLTGLRRGQSASRSAVPFVAFDRAFGLLKANPIADWALPDVEAYVQANGVPVNVLHARGFPSIGCQPCTRAVRPGEDIRAGRWWWETEDGKECGLHKRPSSAGDARS